MQQKNTYSIEYAAEHHIQDTCTGEGIDIKLEV